MNPIKQSLKILAIAASVAIPTTLYAADIDINADENDIALHGYDPVSYFNAGQPAAGTDAYLATYKNAIFKFASLENRNTFRENPERYLPQYGGYCAFGTKVEKKFDIDPLAWKVENGKLYLNKDKNVQRIWVKDVPGNIEEANVAWPKIKHIAANEL